MTTRQSIDMADYAGAAGEVINEIEAARKRFAPMQSAHEGYAVLLEEVNELWAEVRGNKRFPATYRAAMRSEAIQVAAMAVAFMVEVCDDEAD